MAARLIRCVALSVIIPSAAWACTVPVFRYALDRWPGEIYELRVDRAAALKPEIAPLLDRLRTNAVANLSVKTPPAAQEAAAKLVFPDPPGGDVWSGALTAANLEMLLDSPLRRELARRIVLGDSAVWVLVESGDKASDDETVRVLEERFKQWATAASLPEQDPNDPSSQIGPGPALAMRFSVLRLSRKDPREVVTLAMLEANSDEVKKLRSAPVAFPVFGRGRVLAAVPKENLSAESIDEICAFLTGACSCQVKDSRTGWDLMLSFNWDEELARVEEERQSAGAEKSPAAPSPAPKAETVTIRGETAPDKAARSPSARVWIWSGLLLAVIAGVAWAGWSRKKP
ncbi:MAG: hypothetical protein HZC54_00370 [Verrucomicrobia bacterium]|nr:hypothetical protein [Verrucomicrobiota bacterium]